MESLRVATSGDTRRQLAVRGNLLWVRALFARRNDAPIAKWDTRESRRTRIRRHARVARVFVSAASYAHGVRILDTIGSHGGAL